MKVLIVVNSLQQGGAERAAIRLAESFQGDGNHVTIATWNSQRDFYVLNDTLHRIDLGNFFEHPGFTIPFLGKRLSRIGQIFHLKKFRREIVSSNPDIVIAFESLVGSVTALSLFGSGIPIIVSERINPDSTVYKPHKIAEFLRPAIYKLGVICSVQTKGYESWVKKNWDIQPFVTPNHIPKEWIVPRSEDSRNSRSVVSIGRYSPQKGFENLISAWNRLGAKTIGWELNIYGRKDDPEYFEKLMKMKNDNIFLYEASPEVHSILDKAAIFVSSSLFEGFPNVVLESMARGIPTIASFSSDIVNEFEHANSLLGYEPNDLKSLEEYLDLLISDFSISEKISSNAHELISKYTWDFVGAYWYAAISGATLRKPRT